MGPNLGGGAQKEAVYQTEYPHQSISSLVGPYNVTESLFLGVHFVRTCQMERQEITTFHSGSFMWSLFSHLCYPLQGTEDFKSSLESSV